MIAKLSSFNFVCFLLTELEISFDEEEYSTDERTIMGLSGISFSFLQVQTPFSMELIPVTIHVAITEYDLSDFFSLDDIARDQKAESGG